MFFSVVISLSIDPFIRTWTALVTQGTNRCQMKDMNKIFPEIPYGLLLVKWFGHQSLLKSSVFSKCSKMLKSGQNLLALKLVYLDTFFQNVAIHRLMKIMT